MVWPSSVELLGDGARSAARISGCSLARKTVNGNFVDSATVSGPGAMADVVRQPAPAAACAGRRRRCPTPASSTSAASATVRASTPLTVMPLNASASGQVEIRPRCGLMPTRWSTPPGCARCPRRRSRSPRRPGPAATAAALPPDEPPGVCSRDHGFRVCPKPGPLVNGHWPSSQVLVLPTITAPAARSRRTTSASAVARPPTRWCRTASARRRRRRRP